MKKLYFLLSLLYCCVGTYGQVPTISSFTPFSGSTGTFVTITGTNFSSTSSNNLVDFGDINASVVAATTTQLTVIVPPGAGYNPIAVTVAGLKVFSNQPFIATFTGGGTIDANSFSCGLNVSTDDLKVIIGGDIDQDGKTDIVAIADSGDPCTGGGFISIFRNIALSGAITSASFSPQVQIALAFTPVNLQLSDVDLDGKPDILVIANGVYVFRNISVVGTPSFESPASFSAGLSPSGLTIKDFDLDGKPDVAVTNYLGNSVSILRNTSTVGIINSSTFAASFEYATGTGPSAISAADIDEDGKQDLIIANFIENTVSLLKNNATTGPFGPTSFNAKVDFATGLRPGVLRIGDMDGDTRLDLVIGNRDDNSISIFRNSGVTGNINSSSLEGRVDYALGTKPTSMVVNDLDGDGRPDIGVSSNFSTSSKVSVFKNNSTSGSINSSSLASIIDFEVGLYPGNIVDLDFDGDSKPDLIVNHPNALAIGVYGRKFTVLRNIMSEPALSITSFPVNAEVGNSISIEGTGFGTLSADNLVKINGITATVSSSTTTSITVTIPTGATTGVISIVEGCNTTTSAGSITITCIPAMERAALVALYNATNGAAWITKTNWLNGNEATWYGVTTASCRIKKVNLYGNNLSGPIPIELGNLVALEDLTLASNQLTGSIPIELSNLTQLKKLNLSQNKLDGTIPIWLAGMGALTDLNLSSNQLSGNIPIQLGNLNALEYLELDNNQLIGVIPTELASASQLRVLNLSENNLSGPIPGELGDLSELGSLQAYKNQLTGSIPKDLANATELHTLWLSENQLTGSIPSEFGNLPKLSQLILDKNQLTGSIPQELGNATKLFTLRLSNNQLTNAIPLQIGSLPELFTLDLSFNLLTGPIPVQLGNLSNLFWLNLSNNLLTETIPSELAKLTNVRIISLQGNKLSGSIPPQLGNLKELISLGLSSNQLTGVIPPELSKLSKMSSISLSYNQLSGDFPTAVANASNFTNIFIDNNKITNIPFFPNPLAKLYVASNQLTFEDLEVNVSRSTFSYDPQATLPGGVISTNIGSILKIPFTTGGTANQYQWYKDGVLIPGATTMDYSIPSATLNDAGSYTVSITNTIATGLTLTSLPFEVSVSSIANQPPVISEANAATTIAGIVTLNMSNLISDPDNNLDFSTLSIIKQPTSGARATIEPINNLVLDYSGISFSGTDQLTIGICDDLAACSEKEISIEVVGAITVFNAISPNGDGKNEILTIQYIDILPETKTNKVYIYSRWGDEVFSISDYNNGDRVFKGDSNNGSKLPSGTYFYKIVFPDGKETLTGFLELKY